MNIIIFIKWADTREAAEKVAKNNNQSVGVDVHSDPFKVNISYKMQKLEKINSPAFRKLTIFFYSEIPSTHEGISSSEYVVISPVLAFTATIPSIFLPALKQA